MQKLSQSYLQVVPRLCPGFLELSQSSKLSQSCHKVVPKSPQRRQNCPNVVPKSSQSYHETPLSKKGAWGLSYLQDIYILGDGQCKYFRLWLRLSDMRDHNCNDGALKGANCKRFWPLVPAHMDSNNLGQWAIFAQHTAQSGFCWIATRLVHLQQQS